MQNKNYYIKDDFLIIDNGEFAVRELLNSRLFYVDRYVWACALLPTQTFVQLVKLVNTKHIK